MWYVYPDRHREKNIRCEFNVRIVFNGFAVYGLALCVSVWASVKNCVVEVDVRILHFLDDARMFIVHSTILSSSRFVTEASIREKSIAIHFYGHRFDARNHWIDCHFMCSFAWVHFGVTTMIWMFLTLIQLQYALSHIYWNKRSNVRKIHLLHMLCILTGFASLRGHSNVEQQECRYRPNMDGVARTA